MQLDEIAKKTYRNRTYDEILYQARVAVHQSVKDMTQYLAHEDPTSSEYTRISTAIDDVLSEINHTDFRTTGTLPRRDR